MSIQIHEDSPFLRHWFIFGESPDGAMVDIADSEGDVFTDVPRATALRIIAARDRFIDEVLGEGETR